GPTLGGKDRPEQERLPGDLHAGRRGQCLDAHGREVGIGGGEVIPELEPGAWHRSISRLSTVARSRPAERLKHFFPCWSYAQPATRQTSVPARRTFGGSRARTILRAFSSRS